MLQVLLLHRYIWSNADIDRVSARPFSDKLINYWEYSLILVFDKKRPDV